MRTKIIMLLFLISTFESKSQNFVWANSIGSTGWDFALAVSNDATGNVYSTGFFYGTVDFDSGPGTYTLSSLSINYDVYITKHDAVGNLIWAKNFGGGNNANGTSVTIDANNNSYLTGFFSNTCDFDPGPATYTLTSNGNDDVFVIKLDASGNFVWAKNFGGNLQDKPNSIAVDLNGNVYTTGYYKSTGDFDPGSGTFTISAQGAEDIYISKLDPLGNFVWAKSIGGSSNDWGFGIALDPVGNVYSTGYYTSTVDFDPGPGIYSLNTGTIVNTNSYVLKLDPNGNFIWANGFGGIGDDHGYAIAVNSTNVYTTGNFMLSSDFDPGVGTFSMTSSGSQDAYISKLDLSGNFVWAKKIGGTAFEVGSGITVDVTGNIYTCGNFQSTIDADPGPGISSLTSNGLTDLFISKLDASGNFLWAGRAGGSDEDLANGISSDLSGNIYTTGGFKNAGDYDPGPASYNITSNGNFDISLFKLSPFSVGILNFGLTDSTFYAIPNPFVDKIKLFQTPQITSDPKKDSFVKIYNSLGILVYNRIINEIEEIDLSNYGTGFYLIQFENNNKISFIKMIKQ